MFDDTSELICSTDDGKVLVFSTNSRTMVEITSVKNVKKQDICGASIIFLRYAETDSCKFFIPKDRYRTEKETLNALSEVFPMISRESWDYSGYSVSLKDDEDRMMMKLAHNVD